MRSDATMTPKRGLIVMKASDIKELKRKLAGLKILSWVTLTCQFDSGPGHHFPINSNTYKTFLRKLFCLKRSQRECYGVTSDATMTPASVVSHG